MANFDDMFDRLSGDSERRRTEKAEKEQREKEERDALFARERDELTAKVLPILEEAKQRFEGKGVPVIISNNWSGEIGRPMHPQIEFRCEKDDQPNKWGGKYKPQGKSAVFSIRDGTFQVGVGKYPGRAASSEKLSGKDEAELIHRGVEEALNSYFASIEEGDR